MFLRLTEIDIHLSDILSRIFPHNPFTVLIFEFFSLVGFSLFIWIIPLVYLIVRKEALHKRFTLLLVSAYGTTLISTEQILKPFYGRTRPWVAQQLPDTVCPDTYSFPSGHAAGAFVCATIFSYYDKKRAWLYYLVAIGVVYSRVFLLYYYLDDTLFGALVGSIVGVFFISIMKNRKLI